MAVHHMTADWENAQGRFLGPLKLLKRAKDLYPELTCLPLMPWDWKEWVDVLEATGRLVPVIRWHVPDAALLYLWAQHDERPADMQALEEQAASGVTAICRWDAAGRAWTRDPQMAQSLHPLDEQTEDWASLVEKPADAAWTPLTYAPLKVKVLQSGHPHLDYNRCIPLFRGWQALLLVEHILAEPRQFPPPTAVEGHREDIPTLRRWCVGTKVDGFKRHRDALEALSWFVAYQHHALRHAQDEAPDPGMFAPPGAIVSNGQFVIRGAALVALKGEEERIAREALERHGVDTEKLLGAASWLGWAARERKRSGHAAASAAYAELMRDAIELMICLGHGRDDVTAQMQDGDNLRREFFPDFEEEVGDYLRHQLRSLATEFGQYPDPRVADFDDARVEEFISWLETKGLLAAHMAVPAIMRYGHRPDRSADIGVALHVAALAAWVEHVAGELTASVSPPPRYLPDKLKGCWDGHAAHADFLRAWDGRWVDKMPFADAVRQLLANPVSDRVSWMARDALVTRQIRNEGLHQGLKNCVRLEMHDATCILLRTAMGAWLVRQ